MNVDAWNDGVSWDSFVRSQPGWTHFHLWGWKRIIEAVSGHPCLYLAALSGNELMGVLPLARVKSPVFGHFLVSLPYLNYGGPLGTPEATNVLVQTAKRTAADTGADLLELRSRRPLDTDLPVSHRKVTVLLDLPPQGGDQVWNGLKAKVRSQVRRPQKEGIEVRFGLEQVDPFHTVYSQHMRDLGTPGQGIALFRGIATEFSEDVWFGCAYHGERPVAAGCGFRWGSEFEITWASALREFNRLAPNMYLYWSFIERCISEGVTVFNFGRCTPGSGTHRFKQQWGGRDEQLWWYRQADGGLKVTPSPDDSAWSWGPRIWRRLPLPVARVLGPRVVRWLP
jgi:FemAB-related protein (PEP-CTERM system-associated)